ncbi:glycosyltransferase family 4 protein [Clostridium perfringens]|nr:glycosyltransferase family 4 protein [Clostridium perfringens]MDK0665323.1 glycosyltransferase family 4 protein [Clostridium perfringens]MDK0943044.1 glycosyltransferase family 4 protein [Clostridium perfringens]
MKVAFYLENEKIKDVDMTNPDNGNPGIGGTQYMIWIISFYLNKFYSDLEVVLLANDINNLPKDIKSIKVNDITEAAILSKKMNLDIFIFRVVENKFLYELLDKINLKSIAWAHNFSNKNELKYIEQCKYVKKYVCVGKQQYNMLIDHQIINKSDYIYNCIDTKLYEPKINNEKKNIICYVGAINNAKGFHKVCKIWGEIKRKSGECELWVIGSGKLYDTNCVMGKYGIAENSYEKKFIKYIIDKDGNIDKNIKFLGVQKGKKKIELMKNAKVGIVNPTAKTETFCISAIEFEAMGIPVVTIEKNGFLDTIKNNETGILVKSDKALVNGIVKLLKDNNLNRTMGEKGVEFVKTKFNIYTIVKEWYFLIKHIKFNESYDNKKDYTIDYNKISNKLRIYNKKIKKIKLFNNMPAIYEYKYYIKDIYTFLRKGV